jgi:hypothetical protein
MSTRQDALNAVQRLTVLGGGPIVVRMAAARMLASLSPLDAIELLQEVISLSRAGVEPARISLSAMTQALEREASSIPFAGQLRRVAMLSERHEVASLFCSGDAAMVYDEDAAKRADAKLFSEPLGQLKVQARLTRNTDQMARFAIATNAEVVRNVLLNPRMTEQAVVRMAARRPARPEPLVAIWQSSRWSVRALVRRALAFNPYLPVDVASKIVPLLLRRELVELSGDRQIHADIREQARILLAID